VIVLIVGEGQLLVDDSFAEELNELSAKLEAAVELGDEAGFRSALAELPARARSVGRLVAPRAVRGFDVIVPPSAATIDEARRLLADKAPSHRNDSGIDKLARSWAWSEDQQPTRAVPLQAGLAHAGLAEHASARAGSTVPVLVVRTRRSDHQFQGGSTYRIGRDPKSDIPMTDPRVSWLHAVLRVDGGAWILEDNGSTNGTFLGPQRVDRVEITADCVVRLGNPDDGPILRCMPQAPAAAADYPGTVQAPRQDTPTRSASAGPAWSDPAMAAAAPPSPEADQHPGSERWWQPTPARESASPSDGTSSRPPQPAPSRERPRSGPASPGYASPVAAGFAPPAGVGSPVYDNLVRRAFAELVQPGRLLFNPPDHMQLSHTERVEVRLTRTLTLDAELLEHLRGHGEPQLEEIPTAPLMAVTLKGDGFRISAYSDEEQGVSQDGITTWEFDVRALERGQQRLVMCVSLRIPVPGQPSEHKSIPVREATIDVQVGVPALIGHFMAGNWQWFIGTAIAIVAVVAAVLVH
jgi:hypothetical protein